MPSPLEALELEFMRMALAELVLLAVAGGMLGAFVVLRGLAFFAHAVGAAAFPGLVVADAAGVSPHLGAAGAAVAYTGGLEAGARAGRQPGDAATGLLLVAALAAGVMLASDVFRSGASVDSLLFGTLVEVDGVDVALSAAVAAVAAAAFTLVGRAWIAASFDPGAGAAIGFPAAAADALLLALVAAAVIASLPAVGALLVSALLVTPAATARLVTRTLPGLVSGAIAIAVAEGVTGLYLAYWLDVSPGPAVAVLAGGVYGAVALVRAARASGLVGGPP